MDHFINIKFWTLFTIFVKLNLLPFKKNYFVVLQDESYKIFVICIKVDTDNVYDKIC